MPPLDVGVVGCGTAGPAAALFLAARFGLGRRAMLMGMCGAADGHPWRWVPGVLDSSATGDSAR